MRASQQLLLACWHVGRECQPVALYDDIAHLPLLERHTQPICHQTVAPLGPTR